MALNNSALVIHSTLSLSSTIHNLSQLILLIVTLSLSKNIFLSAIILLCCSLLQPNCSPGVVASTAAVVGAAVVGAAVVGAAVVGAAVVS